MAGDDEGRVLTEAEALDPPPGPPKGKRRGDSPHPAESRSSTSSNGEVEKHVNAGAVSRGSLLVKKRVGAPTMGKKTHPPLVAYKPPQDLPPAEELMSTFKERLAMQKQNTFAQSEFGSLDIQEVLSTIAKHDVTFVNTQTGSGKSTLVPKAIMESNDEYRVVTTQPRRTATIRLAETVAGMTNQTVGDDSEIGYWIRGDRRGGRHTRLWYMTSYTLLLHLLNNRMAPPFTHIIIDEFHERQPEIEVLVALLRLLLQKPRGKAVHFKLILMSATINADEWETYFQGLSWGLYSNDKQQYTVYDYHLEEISLLTGAALRRPTTFNQALVNPQMYDNSIFVAQQLIKLLVKESQLPQSILVFLPGRSAVSKLRRWVEANLSHRLWPIPWHGSVELAWIKQQIASDVPGKQKIYLATDVAEVSITLPDVVFVIDTCLVKRPHIDKTEPSTMLFPQLVQQWCSRGSVQQRQGRVGRTQQGFYFSLLPIEYAEMLEEYPTPPICHSRLDDLTLHLLHVCASPRALFMLCKRPPLSPALSTSLRSLQEIGAIHQTHLEDGTLTWSNDILEAAQDVDPTLANDKTRYSASFIGLILQRLPVGVQAGLLVFYGLVLGLETLTMILAAIVQTAIPFVTISPQSEDLDGIGGASYEATAQSKERTHRSLEFFCRTSESDLMACIVVFLEWKRKTLEGEEVHRWAEEMCVSLERLVAIDELVLHLHKEIRAYFPCQSYISPEDGITDAVSLQKQLKVHQPILLWLVCVTFGGNAVQVRQVRNESRKQTRESGTPMFLHRSETHPDIHIPSVVTPWRLGHVVIPVNLAITEGRTNVSVLQTMSSSQFLLLLIMLYPVVRYSSTLLDDSQGTYRPFSVIINGHTRRIRCPAGAAGVVLDFRSQFCNCVSALRYRRQHSNMDDVTFVNYLQENTRDAMGGCFSLLRARVDLMTQLWNAMRDPSCMPNEMLLNVPCDETHVFKPSALTVSEQMQMQEYEEPANMRAYQYPDYMAEWMRSQSHLWGNPAAAAAAGYTMMHPAAYPVANPALLGVFHQSVLPPAMPAQYIQPQQPMGPPASPPPPPLPDQFEADDAYAAFRQKGPLVEDSSDED
eukprot:TRINITY_DN8366_c0_g2_i1.p1 TRINITY_DN8366_c0_g2~~TRINITY_DN8366_c0_g2_i1.p1  ORF type:complete len:1097 (+),score=265.77 TRINITY_DN8366_c0_g2_i1:83-3373(+)